MLFEGTLGDAFAFCRLRFTAHLPPPPGGPTALVTVGKHLKKRRLDLGRRQEDVARELGVFQGALRSWKRDRTHPEIRYWPAIIRFLGYDPHPVPGSIGEKIAAARRQLGITQEVLAARLGVSSPTGFGWENNRWKPGKELAPAVDAFLRSVTASGVDQAS